MTFSLICCQATFEKKLGRLGIKTRNKSTLYKCRSGRGILTEDAYTNVAAECHGCILIWQITTSRGKMTYSRGKTTSSRGKLTSSRGKTTSRRGRKEAAECSLSVVPHFIREPASSLHISCVNRPLAPEPSEPSAGRAFRARPRAVCQGEWHPRTTRGDLYHYYK